jgi:hypothetical protein
VTMSKVRIRVLTPIDRVMDHDAPGNYACRCHGKPYANPTLAARDHEEDWR